MWTDAPLRYDRPMMEVIVSLTIHNPGPNAERLVRAVEEKLHAAATIAPGDGVVDFQFTDVPFREARTKVLDALVEVGHGEWTRYFHFPAED